MLSKIRNSWPVVILLVISILICILNYTPGTFLSGWDTLHPEFNFGLNFERIINGVFRSEQGLGAVAAHSHMADLPRIILLYIAHFVMPMSFLRYFYFDLCIIVGTLGMYFFLHKHILKRNAAAFLGSLFYLLNIGTVQTFNVPFEMFTTLFALTPLIFYFATSYLTDKHNRKQNLLLFALISLINSPSAYAATLWYVFFLCFFIYFSIYFITHKLEHKSIRQLINLFLVFVSVNFFWLLPNIYFILTHGKEVAKANINLLFSEQAFLKNKEFGNLWDLLMLKSFYFDWKIYAGNNSFTNLLDSYISYFKNPAVSIISYLLALGFISGALLYAKKLKLKSLPVFSVLVICLLFLMNANFPTCVIFNFLREHLPFFKESLRFPDDKIFNVYVFLVSIFFGYFCLIVLEKLGKIHHKYKAGYIFVVLISVMIILYSLPSLTGKFINKFMRVIIPNEYFQSFDYLNGQPENLRVANLPIHSPWGWVYYDWSKDSKSPSFQGAGFLYFGIKQPLLDRDFDRWNPLNESYYREMSYAIYKQDKKLLKQVVNKYKIGFIMIDKNVINPQNSSIALFFEPSKKLIESTGLVKEKRNFGKIDLYKLSGSEKVIEAVNTNININPLTSTLYQDYAYETYGDYVTGANSPNLINVNYPFRDLIDNQSKLHPDIVSFENNIVIHPNTKSSVLKNPLTADNFNVIPTDISAQKTEGGLIITLNPNIPTPDNNILTTPLIKTFNLSSDLNNLYLVINNKDLFSLAKFSKSPIFVGKTTLNNSSNTVSLFKEEDFKQITNIQKNINPVFSSCEDNALAPIVGVMQNGFKISGSGDLCMVVPYAFLSKQNGLNNLLTKFAFSLNENINVESCLYNLKTKSCIAYKNPDISKNQYLVTYPISSNDTSGFAIKIFLKPDNNLKNTFSLSNFSSSFAKASAEQDFNHEAISAMFKKTQNVSFSKLTLPANLVYNSGFSIFTPNLKNDCKTDAKNAKKEIVTIGNTKTIKYSSVVGSFCDHFSYQNLPHNQSYLISINSKNESGLPLTICLTNYTSRKCDIYSDLHSSSGFNKDIFLLPPMDEDGTGYDINLENLGIKGSPSVNYLNSIDIIPIPYKFLGEIKTEDKKLTNKYIGNVLSFKQYTSWLYVAQISSQPTILSLNKAFEAGFYAYRINCNSDISCIIKGVFAPLYSMPIKNHVFVNNWANGWIINSETNNNSGVIIVYLPQYLEFFGFLILLVLFSLLFYGLKVKNHH